MTNAETYKRLAAARALDEVQSGMRLGLGSGSTARLMLIELAARLRDGRLADVVGVPTSEVTATQARQLGIPLATLEECPQLDLAIDGADEIDPQLNLIKGLGGALLHEKIVAASASRLLIIADITKLVNQLGQHALLPVEVIPFALPLCTRRLTEVGCIPMLRPAADGAPFRTDEGNLILDCRFGPIPDPAVLSVAIHAIPGVVEHGLFAAMTNAAFVAGPAGVQVLRSKS